MHINQFTTPSPLRQRHAHSRLSRRNSRPPRHPSRLSASTPFIKRQFSLHDTACADRHEPRRALKPTSDLKPTASSSQLPPSPRPLRQTQTTSNPLEIILSKYPSSPSNSSLTKTALDHLGLRRKSMTPLQNFLLSVCLLAVQPLTESTIAGSTKIKTTVLAKPTTAMKTATPIAKHRAFQSATNPSGQASPAVIAISRNH